MGDMIFGRGIIKSCRRCGGTGSVATVEGRVTYKKCPRCSGKGGKVARALLLATLKAVEAQK